MVKRLDTYEDWKACITVDCGIPLTHAFCLERIAELHKAEDWPTNRFVATWGDAHRLRVIAWFERAAAELSPKQSAVGSADG
ncbi:hypothetical protein [Rubrimonas cliftonensis]|uniref:Uncharacterized protein n=1 Tax=Rubrimonas cliftonensis TaxID=89524 RepID=A0A1H4FW41_9RHOB|nr:hypothetical protein [Rubrimonas cliftonensis]SEB01536.1 hypothetical protein SAMN05444370_1308 [Rubrimonas cliftonensis]